MVKCYVLWVKFGNLKIKAAHVVKKSQRCRKEEKTNCGACQKLVLVFVQ